MINKFIHKTYLKGIAGSWSRFAQSLDNPKKVQEEILFNFLKKNQDTQFGQKYNFSNIKSISEYQKIVPVANYECLSPWIEKAENGESGILTAEPIKIFERTSGSTSCNKMIPYTQSFLDQMNAGTQAWLYNIYSHMPQLQGTASYWSISPVSRDRQVTPGGIPIGMTDDLEYFGPIARWAIARLMAVPNKVGWEQDHKKWKQLTCQYLLESENLGLISVWSPTFLTLIMEEIVGNLEYYLKIIPASRARQIRQGLGREGAVTGTALWPKLALISCWTDASASQFIPRIRQYFPKQMIQGKGLLATEGIVTFPVWETEGNVVASTSHYLEFMEMDSPERTPHGVHELEVGGQYSPLLTTGSGFYRYHLRDVVECTGYHGKTPILKFLGRVDGTSDFCGEKLSVHQVHQAFEKARQTLKIDTDFFMMIPLPGKTPRYCGLVGGGHDLESLKKFEQQMETEFLKNSHYAYCRKLGQIGAVQAVKVKNGFDRYSHAALSRGMKLGDIKPTMLDSKPHWLEVFKDEIELLKYNGVEISIHADRTC